MKIRATKVKSGVYEHYKGRRYEVLGVARHSETLEEFVVYRALYKSKFGFRSWWVRPKSMFSEKVKIGKRWIPRFKRKL